MARFLRLTDGDGAVRVNVDTLSFYRATLIGQDEQAEKEGKLTYIYGTLLIVPGYRPITVKETVEEIDRLIAPTQTP